MDHTHFEIIFRYYLVGFWFYAAGAAFGEDTYFMGLLFATVPFVALAVWFSKGASKAEAEREEEREKWERRTPAEEKLQNLYRSKVNPLRSELGLEELDVRNESDYYEKLDEQLRRRGLIE